jgi:hypothetical protein
VSRIYEIRDPVHGFIKLSEWERDIIDLIKIYRVSWPNLPYDQVTEVSMPGDEEIIQRAGSLQAMTGLTE